MFTEQPSYSTKPLHGLPSREQFFHVDVENEWDFIAEVIVGSSAQSSTQLDQLKILLESHGIIVHSLPGTTFQSEPSSSIRSPFVTEPLDDQAEIPSTSPSRSYFYPRDVALVHGTRVIEAPPHLHFDSDFGGDKSNMEGIHALFNRLEAVGVDVIRFPSEDGREDTIGKERLVDVEGTQQNDRGGPGEEDGPRFCPSDILILSPALIITRLSSFTNNKGLEYLWSALSQPLNRISPPFGPGEHKRVDNPGPARTTTLLVRMSGSASDGSSTSAVAPQTPSLRSPTMDTSSAKNKEPAYIPLSRALVPINGSVMLYDPALIAEDEARRLKSVLDRVQDSNSRDAVGVGGSGGTFIRNHQKHDSMMSYGTFGSLDRTDDGWQFISVDGLHSISIILVSPRLALLSFVSTSLTSDPSGATNFRKFDLANASKVLDTLGVRAVTLPSADLNSWQPDGGVRDIILVLRRESNLEGSDEGIDRSNGNDQQQDEEDQTEGCTAAVCASLSAWVCGSLASSGASEADVSDRF